MIRVADGRGPISIPVRVTAGSRLACPDLQAHVADWAGVLRGGRARTLINLQIRTVDPRLSRAACVAAFGRQAELIERAERALIPAGRMIHSAGQR